MKKYMVQRRAPIAGEKASVVPDRLDDFRLLLKNNVAIDLKSHKAIIWLVAPDAKTAKNGIQTDRVTLVQGPAEEVETVRWIYQQF